MSAPDPILLRLEIDAGEPISGRLHGERGPARAFAGWLGLAAALEHALQAATTAGSSRSPSVERNASAAVGNGSSER